MASQANKIFAAPFAMLGSIGVIAEGLNFHSLITKYGIKPMIIKAGESKNPLSTFGNVTDKALQGEQGRLELVHEQFIDWCVTQRPHLDVTVCDGRVLTGTQALQVGMVDGIMTSEDYIWQQIQHGHRVLMVHKSMHSGLLPRRRMSISPLDLLPHLQLRRRLSMWMSSMSRSTVQEWMTRMVQTGCVASMILPKVLAKFDQHR
jgi:ClpP class serine protease